MMKCLTITILLGFLAWQGYVDAQSDRPTGTARQGASDVGRPIALPVPKRDVPPSRQFACDGRTYCSQMTSCEEAKFFLKNCPGVKMDGNNDGVPCERQWCK